MGADEEGAKCGKLSTAYCSLIRHLIHAVPTDCHCTCTSESQHETRKQYLEFEENQSRITDPLSS